MSHKLEGKVIVLTGGASGIGLQTAHLLYSRGAILSIADNAEEGLKNAVSSIKAAYPSSTGKITSAVVDVRDRAAVENWINSFVKENGKLDGAANIAGVALPGIGTQALEDIPDEDWDFVMGVNVRGVVNCMRAQIPHMKTLNDGAIGGSIVNTSSIAGVTAGAYNAAYAASKHAVVGLTRACAKEKAPQGIRCNAIAPGAIDTPMGQRGLEIMKMDGKVYEKSIPMGRFGVPEEVAEHFAWLLCDGSSYMTGTIQVFDGGIVC
ncbi:hypothetical protein HYFRA_00000728 [Hymenoscyphus fraxineus]|uniref:NAD(P)-binding protein n=1 Tax=Hymenoscyphus fraxineus TaxID=746836 RepID=A0A9N9KU08_9HELO|nr:hypothetical protein HYFRA_00000728 [Hymenoscyphus fraxineus]